MLVFEMGNDLCTGPRDSSGLARAWQTDSRLQGTYLFRRSPYRVHSFVNEGRIEATVTPPSRNAPANVYLRLRHSGKARIKSVTLNGASWTQFDPGKEWIQIPTGKGEVRVAAFY